MALQKTITLPSGAEGDYVKAARVELDKLQPPAHKLLVDVHLHKSAAHSAKPPMACLARLSFDITEQEAEGDLVALAYAKMKEMPEYADAMDF